MITCRELVELLFDFDSGQLPADRRGHVEEHLRLCPSCVAYLEGYRLTIQMTRQLPRPPLPAGLLRQLRALLEEGRRSQRTEAQGGPHPPRRAP